MSGHVPRSFDTDTRTSLKSSAVYAKRRLTLIVVLLFAGVIVEWANEKYPLDEVHWDSPIYLLRAKDYNEGNYLLSLSARGAEISDKVMNGVYPTDYWSFVRLGHTILLGTLVRIVGTDPTSIHVVTWVYRSLYAVALLLAALLAVEMLGSLSSGFSEKALYGGTIISLVLYMCSGIWTYMSGNLVSEVPAIVVLSMGAWTLVAAWEKQSIVYAAVSGVLAFVLYVVRMETMWIYFTFLGVAVWAFSSECSRIRFWWGGLLATGLGAGLPFLIYSWAFFPLTDPRLLFPYAQAAAKYHAKDGAHLGIGRLVSAAGGLLWIGAFLAVPLAKASKVAQLGIIWMALWFVPLVPGVALGGGPTQARSLTTLMPVLFLLSTVGWAHLLSGVLESNSKRKLAVVLCVSVFFVLVAQPASYSLLRELPGMWRLQQVRAYLVPPKYERVDYHLPELLRVRRFLDGFKRPFVLVASPGMQVADHIMIIQYLDDSRTGSNWQARLGGGAEEEDINSAPLQVHLAAGSAEDVRFLESLPANMAVLLLGETEEKKWFSMFSSRGGIKERLKTEHYALVEAGREHPDTN